MRKHNRAIPIAVEFDESAAFISLPPEWIALEAATLFRSGSLLRMQVPFNVTKPAGVVRND